MWNNQKQQKIAFPYVNLTNLNHKSYCLYGISVYSVYMLNSLLQLTKDLFYTYHILCDFKFVCSLFLKLYLH